MGEALIATERLMHPGTSGNDGKGREVGDAIIATERLMPNLGSFV